MNIEERLSRIEREMEELRAELADPYLDLKDHLASGGKIQYISPTYNDWSDPKGGVEGWSFKLPRDQYRIYEEPTGENLIGKLCWVGDFDRARAVEQRSFGVVDKYSPKYEYPYTVRTMEWERAWPVTREEIEEFLL